MDAEHIEGIKANLKSKSTTELRDMWENYDLEGYSKGGLEAARQILVEGNVPLPIQTDAAQKRHAAAESGSPEHKKSRIWNSNIQCVLALLLIGIGLILFFYTPPDRPGKITIGGRVIELTDKDLINRLNQITGDDRWSGTKRDAPVGYKIAGGICCFASVLLLLNALGVYE